MDRYLSMGVWDRIGAWEGRGYISGLTDSYVSLCVLWVSGNIWIFIGVWRYMGMHVWLWKFMRIMRACRSL